MHAEVSFPLARGAARWRLSANGSRALVADMIRVADLAGLAAAAMLAALWRFDGRPIPTLIIASAVLGCLLAANVLSLCRVYDTDQLQSLGSTLLRAVLGWSAAIIILIVALFTVKTSEDLSRLWVGLWYAGGVVALLAVRLIACMILRQRDIANALVPQIAVIGLGERLCSTLDCLTGSNPAVRVRAVVDLDGASSHDRPAHVAAFGLADLEALVGVGAVDHIFLAVPPRPSGNLEDIVRHLQHLPIDVSWVLDPIEVKWVLNDLPGARALAQSGVQISGLPVIRLLQRPLDGWRYILKGIEDRVLATGLLACAAPIMLIIAVAVRLDSPGPILYRQQRRGFSRQTIHVLKFRTMHVSDCDTSDTNPIRQVTKGDQRVTRFGRFLRRSSLDELPQLLNVLLGEMSIVGPRPHAIFHDSYYADLIDNYLERHRVKPGITGWAQVCGCRGETKTVEEMRRRIELDLEYINNWSLWFDLRILLRTLAFSFFDRNAY